MKIVCQPPPDSPVTATRSGSACSSAKQEVEAPAHGQVVSGDPPCPAQVDLVDQVVTIVAVAKLPHAEPFDVQGEHPALGQVDAADLLVVGRLPLGVVAVDVEDDGDLPRQLFRLVEQAGDPESRECFVANLLDAVAGTAFDRVEPFHLPFGLAPGRGLASEDDVRQGVRPHPLGFFFPLADALDRRHARDCGLAFADGLGERLARADDLTSERLGHEIVCRWLRVVSQHLGAKPTRHEQTRENERTKRS